MKSEYRRLALSGKLDCTSCQFRSEFVCCTYNPMTDKQGIIMYCSNPHSEKTTLTVGESDWCVYYIPAEDNDEDISESTL